MDAHHALIATEFGAAVATVEETERSAWTITGSAKAAAIDDAITRIRVAALPIRTRFRDAAELRVADQTGQASDNRVDLTLMGLLIAGLREARGVGAVPIEAAFVPRQTGRHSIRNATRIRRHGTTQLMGWISANEIALGATRRNSVGGRAVAESRAAAVIATGFTQCTTCLRHIAKNLRCRTAEFFAITGAEAARIVTTFGMPRWSGKGVRS